MKIVRVLLPKNHHRLDKYYPKCPRPHCECHVDKGQEYPGNGPALTSEFDRGAGIRFLYNPSPSTLLGLEEGLYRIEGAFYPSLETQDLSLDLKVQKRVQKER